ncbi:MAG: substrate-binding domain-containing protein [Anaerolineae bacterium]|nr:substrate-binding domain-containing protein [Anaerolineae bacterium]
MSLNEKITIADIAAHAQVSKSTVSRVLNETTPVAADKREAVLAAMAALNYKPNVFAQSLASGQSLSIGVLTQNFGSPVYDVIMRGVLLGLEETPYSPLFADGRWQPETEQRAIETFLDRRVDGLILIGGYCPEAMLVETARHTPLIIVGREVAALRDHCLNVDNVQAAYAVTRYLIDLGHRDIVHITGILAHEDAAQRLHGYRQALLDVGIEPHPDLVIEGNFRRQSGMMATEMLLLRGRPFSAIFCANDQMAFGARLALYRRGLRVPDDVSLVGFDDQPDSAFMTPPLTTMRQPAEEMGRAAAATLLQLIKGVPPDLPLFETELVIRESVSRHH